MSGKLKIIALSNFRYREIALNWARHVEKIEIENYEVICLDNPCRNYLKKRGVKVGQVYPVNRFRKYHFRRRTRSWRGAVKELFVHRPVRKVLMHKILVARELLQAGYDVVLSDSDALWLKNPIEDLFLGNSNDIVASTVWADNAFPGEFRNRYGYTLCTGWMAFRSNPEVIRYFDELVVEIQKQKWDDDQRAFNLFLMSRNPDIKKSDLGDVLVADGVKILTLNEHLVKRGAFSPETYVWHPNTEKRPADKRATFEKKGLWLV